MENMFLTTKEIALKWGVSAAWVTVLCKKGRIEGVIRKGNRWYIPEDAKKPNDRRSCKSTQIKARFRFIDLFAGIGGFHQAMRYLGGECVMAAEINEECKKTYRLNYHTEEKELRGDVTNIQPETIAPFDVLCAGFPCQPFSKAGAQKGFKDKTRGNLFYTIMDTKKIPDNETSLLDDGIPQSFIEAISMFFVACAIYKNRGMKPGDKLSMLVHPSQLKADHEKVFNKVEGLINDWCQKSENKRDIAYGSLKRILVAAYCEYEKAGVQGLPSFDSLEDDIIQAMNVCGRHKVNGDSVPKGADEIYDYNIYVGGTMLGRGLTLKGLAITYIIRTAKGVSTVDTVQQRARWFGYKMKYLDLCRIFAVGKIIREFQEIRDHEEDLWETVRAAKCQGTNFKNMARIFALSDDLKMTRSSVAKTENYTFKFWNKQREFQDVQEYIDSNKAILATVRAEQKDQIKVERFGDGAPFVIVPNMDFDYVKERIFDKFCFAAGEKFNQSVISKLDILLKRKNLQPKVDIIWMRDGTFSEHSIDCGHIPNYSVGRRPKSLEKPPVYLGDDYQFVSEDTMQLQIHEIRDTITNVDSPTLAFYIPKSVIEKLTNLVIQA